MNFKLLLLFMISLISIATAKTFTFATSRQIITYSKTQASDSCTKLLPQVIWKNKKNPNMNYRLSDKSIYENCNQNNNLCRVVYDRTKTISERAKLWEKCKEKIIEGLKHHYGNKNWYVVVNSTNFFKD